jgi:hypothetical protein
MSKRTERLFVDILLRLFKRQQRALIQLGRIKVARWYVLCVKSARSAYLFGVGLLGVAVLLFGGFVLFHIGLFFYLPWTLSDRALLLLSLGGLYFAIGALLLLVVGRQEFWMRLSKADDIVERAATGRPLAGDDDTNR